jgi:HSP20 family protein
MKHKALAPWRWGGLSSWDENDQPLRTFRREMETLQRDMDRLFADFWRDEGRMFNMPEMFASRHLMPRVDEHEDEKGFHVEIELPGMDQKDVDITLADGMLTIRGEKKQEEEVKDKDFYRKERSFGSFRRVLPLPGDVDESKIKASFEKGVLMIDLPKSAEAQKKVKHITIKAA